jgi:peptidoglycan hydrolase-like protein with peptidoglycan-binding domain
MEKINISAENISKRNVADLHTALKKLNLKVVAEETDSKRIGETTVKAIKDIQERNKMTVTGEIDTKTIRVLNAELFDVHHTQSKTRTAKLHALLEKVGTQIPEEEKKKRIAGPETRAAIESFQKKYGLKADGQMDEVIFDKLHKEAIKETYSTKTQRGNLQKTLLKVNAVAKLNLEIASDELKEKTLGTTSVQLVKAFQEKYKLPATGEINKATLDKLTSVAASKGTFVKKLKSAPAEKLTAVTKPLRLNMISPKVAEMQKVLSFLGYKIAEQEFKTQTFGKTTINAVKKLQQEKGLPSTGHYDKATSNVVNGLITAANPQAAPQHRYRIRGSVRNELWQPKSNMLIKVFLKEIDQEGAKPLGEKKNFLNGFFDIAYDAPINSVNGKIQDKFHLTVKLYEMHDKQNPVAVQTHYNVNPIHWVNFTASKNKEGGIEYNGKYAGTSDYVLTKEVLQKAIGKQGKIEDLHETETDKRITLLSFQTGLSTDDIMCHVLARLVAKSVNAPTVLTDEVFYAFIRQNLPADLPGDLLRGTSEWETIAHLTELTASGIVFLDDATQQQVLDNAITQNIVSQQIKVNQSAIKGALEQQRKSFTLTKPILVGNGTLQSLLDQSAVDSDHYSTVASVFLENKGVFWEKIKEHEAEIGTEAVADFTTTVELGNVAKNHIPTVRFFKEQIAGDSEIRLNKASDIAKLDQKELESYIGKNGNQVPENMPGNTVKEKVSNFAAAIKSRAEFLYPAVSLVAAVSGNSAPRLANIAKVENFIDEQQEFNLREHNIDKYLLDKPEIDIDAATKENLKVVQRIHRITPKASVGAALINEGLHSSMQIYFMGKDRLMGMMNKYEVKEAYIHSLHESAKMRYMQILARLMEYRREFYRDMPRAIIPYTYKKDEIKDLLGDIPNLEVLFGSLDYCDCQHCKSLYSPSAYFVDILRFLKKHNSLIKEAGEREPLTVKDILFKRRPDLGNIKLNCVNTDTPLPYIDLICEILENNLVGEKSFTYQTTLSQKELRAIPEYVRPDAYATIAQADFPMSGSFHLWQEESRTYLNHLRVPRYQLMEAFQDKSDPDNRKPSDAAITAEYFGISAHERDLIVTARQGAAEQKKYWGETAGEQQMPVSLFMKRAKLSYNELLELLLVKFVNTPESHFFSRIERPLNTCNTDAQSVGNLTPPKLDLMHRFIRLWRKTGWKMWELDLLIRTPKIGGKAINNDTLIKLKQFSLLQKELKLPFETLLAFYGEREIEIDGDIQLKQEINREVRVVPDRPDVIIQPLYNRLFQNFAVTNPVDKHFEALNADNAPISLDGNITLGVNEGRDGYTPVPTILSALALQQTDLDVLVKKTDKKLSVHSLSILLRYAYLARALKLTVTELFLFLSVTNTEDPFSSIQTTLDSIDKLKDIKPSGLSLRELDYILHYNEESPVGLRDESIRQMLEQLRKILEESKEQREEVKVNIAHCNSVLAFDADALSAMSDDQLIAALTPLQDILKSATTHFLASAFSVQEANSIILFDTTSITSESKDDLAGNIKKLQKNISQSSTTFQQSLTDLEQGKKNQIKSHIAVSFGLTNEQAAVVLEQITPSVGAVSLLQTLGDDSLIEKDENGDYTDIDSEKVKKQRNTLLLLHKTSLLLSKMRIETEDLKWFIENYSGVETINFSALPIATTEQPGGDYQGWYNLYIFLRFKAEFPEPENTSLRSVLALALDSSQTKEDIFSEIATLTQWDSGEISSLHTGLNLHHTADKLDYTKAAIYHRLLECFKQMKLTGVDATTMLSWTNITSDIRSESKIAEQTRQAVKSKYEQEDWLEKITPLHNEIREKKRAALVEYHLENSQRNINPEADPHGVITNPLYWENVNALYKYFLIDVEMSACQLTSRIKQAISSVQLFVQRCFLNLESRYVKVSQDAKEDKSSPNAWSQWRWMKNYRVWEANRKIFFYPENWLEPELRDDKSPFFEELENELMQNEITKEHVEEAFQNYLHKVDEVSHLEVCGLYHQMEDLNPDEAGYETNIVHVVGRTKAIPSIYYYRTYDMNYSTWSAWEKIEVDITGDHLTPVVYNRKLHLFWLQFMEKPMKAKKVPAAKPTNGPTDAPEPMKVLEIQLGWSIKKSSGWTPKKISKQKLIHPWERPHFSYNLKPYYLAKFNELYLDIYLSTSKEFNNRLFYAPDKKLNPDSKNPTYRNPTRLTKTLFDETYLPWHSSSFTFDGEIKEIKLKSLPGHYNFFEKEHWVGNSYDYVHGYFGEDGEVIKKLDPKDEGGPRLKLPTGMHFHNTHLVNNTTHARNDHSLNILEGSQTTTLLSGVPSSSGETPSFELVITQQTLQMNSSVHPMFFQDNQRAFFIKPEWLTRINYYKEERYFSGKYRFMPFYHPYTSLFISELNRDGLDGVLNRRIQTMPESYDTRDKKDQFNFNSYVPSSRNVIVGGYTEVVDFSFGSANSIYNWELFFHAPLMVACRLMQNQKFEDAMNWFHHIFDPTNIEGDNIPQRYWITKPFHNYNSDEYRKQRIESILSNLNLEDNKEQLKAWRNNPFKPHVIARYRPVAYQKSVVMKYIDNLIAWGDMLFKRDSIESINEASLLYMLAYEILGDRPQKVPNVEHEELTFNELENKYKIDEFGNARVDVRLEDNLLPITVIPSSLRSESVPILETSYFCIPNNDFLSKYWDTVEDRLFKIRHCMNIQGVVRQLPLFEPPIDPALLVKAAAAGMDLGSVLNDLSAPTPHYRFRIVVQKAIEFCNEVKILGEKLLNALEKKDVEELALLRSQHEIQLLEAVKGVRKKQIDEAVETIGSLNKLIELAEEKKSYYENIPRMNLWEEFGALSHGVGIVSEAIATIANTVAAGVYLIPQFKAGAAGFCATPTALVEFGGEQAGKSASKFAAFFQGLGTIAHSGGSMLETQGSYTRRDEENKHQAELASIEKDQIQFQINAAMIRQAIAEKELENQELQIENVKTVDDYMQNKFSNRQLYSWMITQISTVYFQAYQLAFDMAKKAEKCYQYELGISNSNIIQFGSWDSLKKGLLSGDKLMNDLRRLEAEYLNQNRREFEITKHISLAQMAPLSLITLKETGKCSVSLPEWLFDMDYPGHYMRRIKNVSLSIPCITGPFTGVNCTLSLLKNETRMEATLSGGSYEKQEDDTRFKIMYGEISSIATSHAQNDSGMFELNFNDERYLPFEGAGAISDWQINMPIENNYFDFASLSDVVLHINYTSRNGGGAFAKEANTYMQSKLPDGTARLFSLKHEFASEWHRFLYPENGKDQELVIALNKEHYPFFVRGKLSTLKIKQLDMFIESNLDGDFQSNINITNAAALLNISTISRSLKYNDVHHASVVFPVEQSPVAKPNSLAAMRLKIKTAMTGNFTSLTSDQVDNIFILVQLGA